MARKLTTEEWVERAREKHGDRYGYEQVVYEGAHKKVTITCKEHGYFLQTPSSHLSGNGCRHCHYDQKRNDSDDFFERAYEVHGDRYDYRNTKYVKSLEKVEIICGEHGGFWQTPSHHLSGQGCPECGGRRSLSKNSGQWFIEKAERVHKDKYEYDQVVYVSAMAKVKIACRLHGDFLQTPAHHLSGNGCPECGGRRNLSKNSGQWFIEKSKLTHGSKYDYSNVFYTKSNTLVSIGCPKHGLFKQCPSDHVKGQGCPKCFKVKMLRGDYWNDASSYGLIGFYGTLEQSNLYILRLDDHSIKVGLAKSITSRMNTIYKESGYSVEKLYSVSGPAFKLFVLEQTILRLSNMKQHVPDVKFGGDSECLELGELDKVMDIVKEWEKFNTQEEVEDV